MAYTNVFKKIVALERTLLCQVCCAIFEDPIVIGQCGDTFCKKCISQLPNDVCPTCKVPIETSDSCEDKQLRDLIPLVQHLKQLLLEGSNSETKPNEPSGDDTIVIQETPFAASPASFPSENCRPSRITKPATCKAPNCGSSPGGCLIGLSHNKPITVTPQSKSLKKRPLTSPALKSPKRPLYRFLSPFSSRKKSSILNRSLSSPFNVEKRNVKGETLLHAAVVKGDLERVKDLLTKKANPNVKDYAGWTPLHEACNHGYLAITKVLLDNGALLDVPGQDGITPLHDAIMNGQMDIASYLVLKGADIFAKTSLNNTALDLCQTETHREMLMKSYQIAADLATSQPEKQTVPKKKSKIVILPTSLDDKQEVLLQKFAELLKADVVEEFSSDVTHVVTSCDSNGQCIRTLKFLRAILTGKWVLTTQWMEICLEYKKHVDEEAFEVSGTKQMSNTFGPRLSRRNAKNELPPLFHGFSFHIYGQLSPPFPPKEQIIQLIQLGGGKIITREPRAETVGLQSHAIPYHAADGPLEQFSHGILYEGKPPRSVAIFRDRIFTANVRWLLDCICAFKLIDPSNYN